MRKRNLTLSEIFLIASTRGMLGAGIGLLLSSKLNKEQRRAVGWTLVMVGAVTTIPLAVNLFSAGERSQASALRAA
ncbi:MAG: hypothetical protein WAV20_19705 [Blastocatellia bacterium]